MLSITNSVAIPDHEIQCHFIRAQGAGGQHVNKTATAVHLQFDFLSSPSLPESYKQRLQTIGDQRIGRDGVITIKAQKFRSRERNLEDARQRLAELLRSVSRVPKKRKATKPSKNSQLKRLAGKTKQAETKKLRQRVNSRSD